eukprot:353371-Chlamydomonas_euryale.AAC.5
MAALNVGGGWSAVPSTGCAEAWTAKSAPAANVVTVQRGHSPATAVLLLLAQCAVQMYKAVSRPHPAPMAVAGAGVCGSI